MGTATYRINMRRLAKSFAPEPRQVRTAPPGCRGAACPAFALCQGKCATASPETRMAPDGGVWIEAR